MGQSSSGASGNVVMQDLTPRLIQRIALAIANGCGQYAVADSGVGIKGYGGDEGQQVSERGIGCRFYLRVAFNAVAQFRQRDC